MKMKKEKEFIPIVAHVMFVDIVGYTKLPPPDQLKAINTLESLLRSCKTIKSSCRLQDYLFIPTGDGFAVAFLKRLDGPLLTAIELSNKIKKHSIPCRIGLNTGPVFLREDLNEQLNLVAGGMNFAQRVMDLGDADHILASKRMVELLIETNKEYAPLFHAIGPRRVKHGAIIVVFNFFKDNLGNKSDPLRGRISSTSRRLSGPDDSLLLSPREILGREEEIENVVSFLEGNEKLGIVTASPDVINITGSPGIGKTEVCKAAMRKWLSNDDARCCYYVSLAGAEEVSEFVARLAEAYNVPNATQIEDVLTVISANPCVLYLDNLEGLLKDSAAVELLKRLRDIPHVKVIASSRERLEGIGRDIPIETLDIKAATELFLQESKRCGRGIKNSEASQSFIRDDLGCHPLSLVLVAAQTPNYQDIEGLREAWRKRGTQLARLTRGQQDRLTNLDISISLSLKNLTNSAEGKEAIALWGLMVFFPEGMSNRAFKFFQDQGKISQQSLSLLIRISLAKHGSVLMLPPLIKFAESKALLKEDGFDIDSLIETAYSFFLATAGAAQEHICDEQHMETLDAVLAEISNLHRFLSLAIEHRKDFIRELTTLSSLMGNFYQFRAFASSEILSRIASAQKGAGLSLGNAHSLLRLGDLESRLGQIDEAQAHYNQAIELFRSERDNLGLANALKSLGDLESRLGQINEAQAHYNQAIELFRSERNNLGLANVLQSQGDLYREMKDFETARKLYEKARELYLSESENMGLAFTCAELARTSHALGNRIARDEFLTEAFSAAEKSNVPMALEYVKTVQKELLRKS